MSIPFSEMERDDDDGVGYVAESHYLKSPTVAEQQAMRLLQVPGMERQDSSISSNMSDMDVPIYSSENLTTRPIREVRSVSSPQQLIESSVETSNP
ncbi:hypothetical protein GWI33_017346 [Rhynchophorus ferrugineus]|uniref:Uncharacterized protein n=1 Tax=Rhynchophorus ferrugineus TaxID=354439 RepID=A0A834M2H9_RHYFE|nr:hypothetical protein GWI33_017346 [Rhynchophorus ferrugineus]